jgi:hypothetical protein
MSTLKKETVIAAEEAAFFAYNEMLAMGFKKGGMSAVIQLAAEAMKIAEPLAEECQRTKKSLDMTKSIVASGLMNWSTGIIKSMK